MTVEAYEIATALTDGIVTDFPFTFSVSSAADVRVTLEVIATGVQVHVAAEDFTVTLGEVGGTVTYLEDGGPVPTGTRVILWRETAISQTYSVNSQTKYNPELVAMLWDKAFRGLQEEREKSSRALRMPLLSEDSGEVVPPEDRSGSPVVVFTADGGFGPGPDTDMITSAQQIFADFGDLEAALDDIADSVTEVTTASAEAITKAGEAAASATTALTAKEDAETAQADAETARDAAFVNANVYPDIATGRAAVADGGQFAVVDGYDLVRYRRDSSSTQTEVARIGTAALLNLLRGEVISAKRDLAGLYQYTGSTTGLIPIITDDDLGLVMWYDPAIPGIDFIGSGAAGATVYDRAALAPVADTVPTRTLNTVFFYGQSNAIGWQATPPISVGQPFENVKVQAGALVPLVAGTNEQPQYGACNYCTASRLAEDGGAPGDVIMAGGAYGVGGQSITTLGAGSQGFTNITNGLGNLYDEQTDIVALAMVWVQGENDISDEMTGATYKGHFATMHAGVKAIVDAEFGTDDPLHVLIVQPSFKATLYDEIALAQWELCRDNALYHMVVPTYRLPFKSSDNIHLTPAGVKLMGAYAGRAAWHLQQGMEPQSLKPISASRAGRVVTVRFDVPQRPLRFETTEIGACTDHGFALTDGGVAVGIDSITASADRVTITADADFTGDVVVRYGLDYEATGSELNAAGAGNLVDSTAEIVAIDGTDYTLFHPAPAFQLPAYALEI